MQDFFVHLESHRGRCALLDGEGCAITYHNLAKRADFWGKSVETRSLVLVVCRNCPEGLAGYLGLMRNDAVPMLVHHTLSHVSLLDIVQCFNPGYVLCPLGHASTFTEARTLQRRNGYILLYLGKSPDMHSRLSLLLTTSGSTGSRSFVRISRDNILYNAASIAQSLRLQETDRAVTTMPFSYSYGLSIIHSHMLAGASLVTTEHTLVTPAFWRIVRENNVTNFGGVPFFYETLQRLRFEAMKLPSLRLLTQAGGRMDPKLVQSFVASCAQKDKQFIVMYGQTEATARMSYVPWEDMPSKGHTVGIPIPGGDISLVNENGHPICEPECTGELVYSGPNVSLGLAQSAEDLALGDIHEGKLYTGDMACRDNDGFFRIVGRKKRFLKIFGHRVSLDETEGLLEKAGYQAVCCGHDDQLCVFTTQTNQIEDIRTYLLAATSLHHKGISIHKVAHFPRLESGKLNYQALMSQTEL